MHTSMLSVKIVLGRSYGLICLASDIRTRDFDVVGRSIAISTVISFGMRLERRCLRGLSARVLSCLHEALRNINMLPDRDTNRTRDESGNPS